MRPEIVYLNYLSKSPLNTEWVIKEKDDKRPARLVKQMLMKQYREMTRELLRSRSTPFYFVESRYEESVRLIRARESKINAESQINACIGFESLDEQYQRLSAKTKAKFSEISDGVNAGASETVLGQWGLQLPALMEAENIESLKRQEKALREKVSSEAVKTVMGRYPEFLPLLESKEQERRPEIAKGDAKNEKDLPSQAKVTEEPLSAEEMLAVLTTLDSPDLDKEILEALAGSFEDPDTINTIKALFDAHCKKPQGSTAPGTAVAPAVGTPVSSTVKAENKSKKPG